MTVEKDSAFERILNAFNAKTATEVAGKLGLTPQAVSKWDKGGGIKFETLISITTQTGVSIHWLLTGQGEKYVGGKVTDVTKKLAPGTTSEDTSGAPSLIPGIGLPTASLALQPVPLVAALSPEGIKPFRRAEARTVLVPSIVVREGSVIFMIEGNALELEGLRDGDLLIAVPASDDVDGKLVVAIYDGKPIIRELTTSGKWALFSALEGNSPVLRLPLGKIAIKFEVTSMIHNFSK